MASILKAYSDKTTDPWEILLQDPQVRSICSHSIVLQMLCTRFETLVFSTDAKSKVADCYVLVTMKTCCLTDRMHWCKALPETSTQEYLRQHRNSLVVVVDVALPCRPATSTSRCLDKKMSATPRLKSCFRCCWRSGWCNCRALKASTRSPRRSRRG